jgi:hypothetical protein|tara:strand:+ start:434 stop:691 length:258 start_codon:yes stop_codon:yes gene_type:complete
MAVVKTSAISEIVVTPAKSTDREVTDNDSHPVITINNFDTYTDDVTDNVTDFLTTKLLSKFTDGSPTDVTGEDAIVQGIASSVWS